MNRSEIQSRLGCAVLGEGCVPALTQAERATLAKGRRVVLLILAICMMSFADLVITLTYMRSVGMIEVNPIARYFLATGTVDQLIRFKLFTMVLSCGVLYILRKHPRAEFGAWVCAGMLLLLTLHWVRYNGAILDYTNELCVIAQSPEEVPEWIHLRD